MAQYELEGLFGASFDGLKGMIDTDTVIGKPVVTAKHGFEDVSAEDYYNTAVAWIAAYIVYAIGGLL